MITEDYVGFETAKLLKEKGFDEDIDLWYDENGEMFSRHKYDISSDWRVKAQQKVYLSPTLQMAMKWLRETHNYDISICLDSYVEPFRNDYYIVIRRRKDKYENISPCDQIYFKTYEEACEAAIKYCLENLIEI